ncbi:unnamed protein product, partial [Chrysoparadoxa australica]
MTRDEMREVLGRCPDFAKETGMLQKLLESKGHVLLMSPKFHPELAGVGIEYSWGKAKQDFRSQFKTSSIKALRGMIQKVLTTDVLLLERMQEVCKANQRIKRMYKQIVDDSRFKTDENGVDFLEVASEIKDDKTNAGLPL